MLSVASEGAPARDPGKLFAAFAISASVGARSYRKSVITAVSPKVDD